MTIVACILRPLFNLVETLCEFEGSDEPMAYWVRGHVDKAEFAREVNLEYRVDCYTADDVEHTYYRNVPIGRNWPKDYTIYESERGRGAYAVTVIDVDHASMQRFDRERAAKNVSG